jgi:hypothetical protein
MVPSASTCSRFHQETTDSLIHSLAKYRAFGQMPGSRQLGNAYQSINVPESLSSISFISVSSSDLCEAASQLRSLALMK